MALKYVQTNTFYQAGSGSIIGATSVALTTFTDIYGNVLTMADFADKGYITFEPDTINEESGTFTGVTANANGTYTLTGVKTALAKSPYTETSGLVRQHSGGTKVVVSDTTAFWNTFANKTNDETITGQWTFNTFPVTPGNSPATTTTLGVVKMAAAPDDAASPYAVSANRVVSYSIDAVGTDAYAITPSPAITAYASGQRFLFKAGTANTGAATLAVSGLAAKTIKKNVTQDLNTGDILANQIIEVIYDSVADVFQFISKSNTVTPIVRVYSANDTWSKPSGLAYVVVEVQGGGGGGGGNTSANQGGAGGGGGGYSLEILQSSSLGSTEAVTVGAAGTAGGGAPSAGGTGGTSSFGTAPFLQATGGGGGDTTGSVPGAAGVGSNGTLNIKGTDGGQAVSGIGGGISGFGGSSFYGGGAPSRNANSGVGVDGNIYGGGGSGGWSAGGADTAGGAGAVGVVKVTEYYA